MNPEFPCCPQSRSALERLVKRLSPAARNGRPPVLVGIGGPGGSGKSQLSRWLCQVIPNAALLSLDDFRLPRHQRPPHAPFGSHPDAVDLNGLCDQLHAAREGRTVHQPEFDRQSGCSQNIRPLPKAAVYLLDGEITAYPHLQPHVDLQLLVTCSLWTQLRTRLNRDRRERDCSLLKTGRIFVRSNLLDYPRWSHRAAERSHLVFHRHRHKGLLLRKDQLEEPSTAVRDV